MSERRSARTDPVRADLFTRADRDALVAGSAIVAQSGSVVGSAGNLSVRRDDQILITPRGARLGALDPAGCVSVARDDGAVVAAADGSEPSSETPLHRAVYAALPDAAAVVHTHSHFATVLSTLVTTVPAVHYVTAAFGGPVRVAPYATFGSQALADGVAAALEGRNVALMANHGAVATGPNLEVAVERAQQLEWLASVAWHALACGSPVLLEEQDLEAVAAQSRTLRYGVATA